MYPRQILHWIDDAEVASASGETFEKRCPIDDRVAATVSRGSAADVDRAVTSAAAAAESWGRLPAPRRGEVLGRAAALLRAREVIFPLAPLSRTILETSGHIAWLLDPRPTVRQRAARAFLARVVDVTRGKAAAKALNQPLLNSFGDALHQLRKVDLPQRFYPSEIERTDAGELIIAKQRYPGLSALMPYLDEVHRHDWNSPGMYSWLSNVSHPTPNVLLVLSAPDGDLARIQIPDAGYPYRICRAGLLAFLRGWALLYSYVGHDSEPIDNLADVVDALPED